MSLARSLLLLCTASPAIATSATPRGAPSHAPRSLPSFAEFISTHDRKYIEGTSEYDMRYNLYLKRVGKIQQHNSNPERRWNAVVNHLTDQTEAELKRLYGLKIMPTSKTAARPAGFIGAHKQFLGQVKSTVVPEQVSWTHLKAVQENVNQESCGSCWALATSTMLQAHAEIHGRHRSFSPQELVDCVPNPHNCGGSGGCEGATVELGMNWIMANGLDTWEGTPYWGVDGICKKDKSPSLIEEYQNKLDDLVAMGFHPAAPNSAGAKLGIQGWERLPENDYEPLLVAVATKGPVAVSVGASNWNSYGGGVFDSCTPDSVVNHAVTLVGYGSDPFFKVKYWHIKNSWSNNWGEAGFIRLLRHEGNVHCGTDTKPEDGTGCDGGPPSVRVCGMCGILYDSVVPHMM